MAICGIWFAVDRTFRRSWGAKGNMHGVNEALITLLRVGEASSVKCRLSSGRIQLRGRKLKNLMATCAIVSFVCVASI